MAGRPRLEIGKTGKVAVTKTADGQHVARCRARFADGRTRIVEGRGTSAAAAKRALTARVKKRLGATGSGGLTADTPLGDLLDRWLASRSNDPTLSSGSRDEYERCIKGSIKPVMGEIRLAELHAGLVDERLQAMAKATPGRARQARTILRQACSYAVRHQVWPVSPVHDLTPLPGRKKRARALSRAELAALREVVRAWEAGDPRRSPDIGRILDLGLATGCRIGEIAGLRWEDVDLEGEVARVSVSGTAVSSGDLGQRRQESRKGGAHAVVLILPEWGRAMLVDQRSRVPSDVPWVFPSRAGTMRSPNNIRRSLRSALKDTVVEGTTPHTIRATVATTIKRLVDLDAASGQLGHGDTAVTAEHYIERVVEAPDLRRVLDELGPDAA